MEIFKEELKNQGVNDDDIKRIDAFANKLDTNKSVNASLEKLREVDNIRANISSGSKFGYQSLINQLIRLSGDNRINEYDRKAFIESLNIVDSLKVKLTKALNGGALKDIDKEKNI